MLRGSIKAECQPGIVYLLLLLLTQCFRQVQSACRCCCWKQLGEYRGNVSIQVCKRCGTMASNEGIREEPASHGL